MSVNREIIKRLDKPVAFLLSLFLLSTTIQCMEPIKEIVVVKPRTMQDIRDERDAIYKGRAEKGSICSYPLDSILFQRYWDKNLNNLKKLYTTKAFYYEKEDGEDEPILTWLDNSIIFKEKGYSFLGLATIAKKEIILSEERFGSNFFLEEEYHLKQILDKENTSSIRVSFAEAKEHIQQLLTLGFDTPTEQDYYFLLLAKYEEFGPCIIQKICTLQNAPLLTEINLPTEINSYIALLMFNIEESLL